MDPSSISPPPSLPAAPIPATNTVPFSAEPNDLPQPPIPAAPSNHPPYAEMIYTAIEALKEKNGSSKRAIAKYIEQVYKDQLPPTQTHSSLLTQHLKRLKNSGLLQMVKKSYRLPRSVPVPATAAAAAAPGSTSQSPKPRGRPRKAQTQTQPNPQPQDANNPQQQQQQNAEPVWAALGLADEPVQAAVAATDGTKKRPGRPRKSVTPGVGQSGPSITTPGRRGRPPGSSKKRPGRPPKAQPVTGVSGGPKRRPGRPPKNQSQATQIPFAQPAADAAAELPAQPAAGAAPVQGALRPRGRPKRNASVAVAAVVAGARGRRGRGRGVGAGGGRGRGRGRGGLPAQPRKTTGRPVGRPKKGSTSAGGSSQNAANEELKRKLEHFQSKVKESLAVLKPHFNHESPVTAIAAIQELEVLGTMDLNAPLRDETLPLQQDLPPQQPPVLQQQQQSPVQQQEQPPQQQQLSQHLPPQQLLSQPQLYQQQFPQFHLPQFHHQQPLQFQQQPQQQQPQPQLFQHQPPPPHHQQFHP